MGMSGGAAGAVRAAEVAGEAAGEGLGSGAIARGLGTAAAVAAGGAGLIAGARAGGFGENAPTAAEGEHQARQQLEADNRSYLAYLTLKENRGEQLNVGEKAVRRMLAEQLNTGQATSQPAPPTPQRGATPPPTRPSRPPSNANAAEWQRYVDAMNKYVAGG